MTFVPTDGAGIAGVNSDSAAAVDQGSGNKVVYDGSGSTVTVTSLAGLTTYHFASFEYNLGTGSSQNYLATSPGRGDRTTNPAALHSSGTGGGLWGSTATWASGVIPTQSDSVVITAPDRVILGSNGSCYSLTVQPGAKLLSNVALTTSPPAYLRVYGRAVNIDGVLGDTMATGANDVYVVRPADGINGGRDVLLPAIADVIEQVDIDGQRPARRC